MCCLYHIFYFFLFPAEYLRGFETFAETSFVIGSHSHTLEWQRYGLKLHIPEGAVLAELRECRVDIKAGFTGQFNIPDDLQLVSCVYWLSCPQKFLKPVTLEIEHCASLQDSSQLSSLHFIVAKCSQAELPYQIRILHGERNVCTKEFLWQHSNHPVFNIWNWHVQKTMVTTAILLYLVLHSEGH